MNGQTNALKQLQQEYEAMFGIQGPRLGMLLVSEMSEAIKTGMAHWRAPARGSSKLPTMPKPTVTKR